MSLQSLERIRCTVLDATYRPISIVSARRALVIVARGKATVTQEHPERMIFSPNDMWGVPTQIVLNKIVKKKINRTALLTQRNLFIRDGYKCQYCNRHVSDLQDQEFLTRDHVHPQSLGGLDMWENVITACSSCNNKKANHVLSKTSMTLLKSPSVPTTMELWARTHTKKFR